ncbi:hypothetical protein HMPREF1346_01355 [Enterococcus faecium 503]|nr:hypothetical protein HMPREF9522_01455 [Enterococcus faecium TX0082]EJY53060.1 hypothetical protein HMPREF1346_01355 [Enterococcus faecium 503]EPI18260.1 hypothetical protein D355_00255 [Enterococcus faecium SD1C-2]MBK4802994.1 hypothetical protein [Enterococcus faecium]
MDGTTKKEKNSSVGAIPNYLVWSRFFFSHSAGFFVRMNKNFTVRS